MWHTVSSVAESRCLDEDGLTGFAVEHQLKYGVLTDRGMPEVNTWHVDSLVRAYQALVGAALRPMIDPMRFEIEGAGHKTRSRTGEQPKQES